jgi:hypothetical protein
MFSDHLNIIGTLELDFYPPGEPIIISCREQDGTLLGLARTRQGDVTWKVYFQTTWLFGPFVISQILCSDNWTEFIVYVCLDEIKWDWYYQIDSTSQKSD